MSVSSFHAWRILFPNSICMIIYIRYRVSSIFCLRYNCSWCYNNNTPDYSEHKSKYKYITLTVLGFLLYASPSVPLPSIQPYLSFVLSTASLSFAITVYLLFLRDAFYTLRQNLSVWLHWVFFSHPNNISLSTTFL